MSSPLTAIFRLIPHPSANRPGSIWVDETQTGQHQRLSQRCHDILCACPNNHHSYISICNTISHSNTQRCTHTVNIAEWTGSGPSVLGVLENVLSCWACSARQTGVLGRAGVLGVLSQ
jgi:hypothetical protein